MTETYKLLVVDIDGTLSDKNGHISDIDKQAVVKASARGIRISLCTGRAVKACAKIFSQLPLDGYHIFFDGALVYNPTKHEEVYTAPIKPQMVKEVAEYLKRIEINMDFYSVERYFIERETWATEIRKNFFGLEPTLTDFSSLWDKEKIIKGTLIVASPEEKSRVRDFSTYFKDSLKLSWTKTPGYPEVDFINVLSPEVSKGAALGALMSYFQITPAEVMAIGDGENDIPLLKAAGLAVGMGNATAEVKAVADYVTLDVEHGGVAAAIEKFLL